MTNKQEQLLNSFLAQLDPVFEEPLYREIAMYLSALGYNPKKQRSYLVFKHDLHGKQMAKMGIKNNKSQTPYFSLRFSACQEYSQKFADAISAAVSKPHFPQANCIHNDCNYCSGEAHTHIYTHTCLKNGTAKSLCGARQLEIPDISSDDMKEIKNLITEEHEYLIKHEAGVII